MMAESLLWKVLRGIDFRFALSSSGQLIIIKNGELSQVAAVGTVTGQVFEAGGKKPLPGASVIIKGTQKGTSTDADGKFTIDDLEVGTHTLVASFIGYKKVEKKITISEGEELNVVFRLKETTESLDEMVVVGYGNTRKKDLTGSISSISSDELLTEPTSGSFDELLGGKMSGVKVSQVSGKAGMGAIVNIRGAASINGDNQPLYIVDGVPVLASQQVPKGFNGGAGAVESANPLLSINPQNIKSVDVLKGLPPRLYMVPEQLMALLLLLQNEARGPDHRHWSLAIMQV